MIEIARSYSRKISLTQYGYPYETIDLFASRKEEVPEDTSELEKNDISDRLAEEAKADVERQQAVLEIKLGEKEKDILRSTQEINRMKKKAKYHWDISKKIGELAIEHPEKTAGELEEMAKEEVS